MTAIRKVARARRTIKRSVFFHDILTVARGFPRFPGRVRSDYDWTIEVNLNPLANGVWSVWPEEVEVKWPSWKV